MPTVHFTLPTGELRIVEASEGKRIMQIALVNDIDGIIGECGGQAMCGTCHVLIDQEWLDALPPMRDDEDEMLDDTPTTREARSRLSCQIAFTAALDGLAVTVPAELA